MIGATCHACGGPVRSGLCTRCGLRPAPRNGGRAFPIDPAFRRVALALLAEAAAGPGVALADLPRRVRAGLADAGEPPPSVPALAAVLEELRTYGLVWAARRHDGRLGLGPTPDGTAWLRERREEAPDPWRRGGKVGSKGDRRS